MNVLVQSGRPETPPAKEIQKMEKKKKLRTNPILFWKEIRKYLGCWWGEWPSAVGEAKTNKIQEEIYINV